MLSLETVRKMIPCYCGCGREATHTVYDYPLCDECYRLHVEGNRLAVEYGSR